MKVMLIDGQEAPYGYRVPCGFLLAAVDENGAPMYRPDTTWAIQSDWDFPALAANFGYAWGWDNHDNATEAISAAYDFLAAHAGEVADVEVEAIA